MSANAMVVDRSPSLFALLDEAAASPVRLSFVPSNEQMAFGTIWRATVRGARWLDVNVGRGSPIAVVLDSTPAALTTLFAAWRSGRRVVSLPTPPRGSSLEAYQRFVERAGAAAGARSLFVAADHVPLLPPLPVRVDAFEAVGEGARGGPAADDPASAELVQFTSGSTSDPKGVLLGLAEISANVEAIITAIEPEPGDGACSWLPLSHDMGLIGMALTALCSAGRQFAKGGDIVFIRPEWFLRRPESWLQSCSQFRSTITAAPDFGFAHAVRRGAPAPVELSNLRLCITGAEPVRADTLRSFGAAFTPSGFDDRAFSPAYGLAEAGLAVTLTRPGQRWSSIRLDARALGDGTVVDAPDAPDGVELVSAGRALDGYEVRTDDATEVVGPLHISGPSLFRQYVPGSPTAGGSFETNDAGFVRDGEVFVVGRLDDVIQLAGRNLYLADLEVSVAREVGMAAGRLQAVRSDEGFALVAERTEGAELDATVARLRRAAVAVSGWSPSAVIVTDRGSLPRTPSGKPRRRELGRQLAAGELTVLHRADHRR